MVKRKIFISTQPHPHTNSSFQTSVIDLQVAQFLIRHFDNNNSLTNDLIQISNKVVYLY